MNVLPPPQRRVWDELVNVTGEFTLYGGTALALQLGHRTSVDFDLFGDRSFDPDELQQQMDFLRESVALRKSENTLVCRVDREGPVQISFFGLPEIRPIRQPLEAPDNGLKLASLIDLAGTKASVVQKRAEVKDYLDLDALITEGGVDLPTALAAGQAIYGEQFRPQITLKALAYFDDIPQLPREARDRLARAVQAVDLDQLPTLERERKPDRGIEP